MDADLKHAIDVCHEHGLTKKNIRVRYKNGKRGDALLVPLWKNAEHLREVNIKRWEEKPLAYSQRNKRFLNSCGIYYYLGYWRALDGPLGDARLELAAWVSAVCDGDKLSRSAVDVIRQIADGSLPWLKHRIREAKTLVDDSVADVLTKLGQEMGGYGQTD